MLVGMSSYRQKLFTFKEEYNSLKVNNSDKYDLSPLTNVRKRTTETKEITIRTVTIILKEKELPSSSFKLAELMKKCKKKKQRIHVGQYEPRHYSNYNSQWKQFITKYNI